MSTAFSPPSDPLALTLADNGPVNPDMPSPDQLRDAAARLVAALRSDPQLLALVGEAVFDAPPYRAEPPYVVLAEYHLLPRDTDVTPGDEQRLRFHVWARDASRKAVLEILINNRAIAKLITSDQSHQIPAQLQTGRDVGMQLMDQALFAAIEAGEVDPDDAFRYASDKRKFKRFVTDTGILPTLDMED